MNRLEIIQEVYGKDRVFSETELSRLIQVVESTIHECVKVVNSRYMGDNNREDMEVRRCVEDLKKHFGVKL